MIIWLASYPKSGNTWLRSLLCSYYFSKNRFTLSGLKKIPRFSVGDFIENKNLLKNNLNVAEEWINVQSLINKKIQIGSEVILKIHEICEPCNYLQKKLKIDNLVKLLVNKSGVRAEIITSGRIEINDKLIILD